MRRLANLKFLGLAGTNVTDAGLSHLHGLVKLDRVWLGKTHVTDSGVEALQEALPDVQVDR